MDRDPFETLALPYDATAADVRRAFRALARETHPDRGGSAETFHRVRAAYSALLADLDGERQRWAPAPRKAAPASRYAGGLDPREFPTCTVRVRRGHGGKTVTTYDLDDRPSGWRPGSAVPRGTCVARRAATADAPAFGVWTVPLGGRLFRCVFGPHDGA